MKTVRNTAEAVTTVEMEARDIVFLWMSCLFYAVFPILLLVALCGFSSGFNVTVLGGVFVCCLGVWRSAYELTNAFSRLEVDGEGVTRQFYWSRSRERIFYHQITKISKGSVGESWLRMESGKDRAWILHGWGPRNECAEVFDTINALWADNRHRETEDAANESN